MALHKPKEIDACFVDREIGAIDTLEGSVLLTMSGEQSKIDKPQRGKAEAVVPSDKMSGKIGFSRILQ